MKNKNTTIFLFVAVLIIFAVGSAAIYVEMRTNAGMDNTDRALACEDCNVIIVSLTNTRKDHIGTYGYERNTTPNIDAFFKNSLIFNNAFTHASWTLPSAVSFFTSLYPFAHGVMQRDKVQYIPENVTTFTELLKEGGYATAAFTGDGDYSRMFGTDRGFDVYADRESYGDLDIQIDETDIVSIKSYVSAASLLPAAGKWLMQNRKKKFFLFVQGFETHCPFTPSGQFEEMFDSGYEGDVDFSRCLWTFERVEPKIKGGEKFWPVRTWFEPGKGPLDVLLSERDVEKMISLYDGEIAQADDALAEFFADIEAFGLEKNTIIIFMSEHGDLFGENGRFMRGGPLRGTFYDPVINFPLMIRHPNVKEPIVVDDLVQMVDLAPTLLSILGMDDVDKGVRQGKKLGLSVFGDKETNEYVYAGSRYVSDNVFFKGTSTVESIRGKKWKLIKETIALKGETKEYYELYDIKNDPGESEDVYGTEKDISLFLKERLRLWSEEILIR
ncbi:MAG: hypothetical protein BMS9Abin13_305 [Patescibacteria group bacterium]|nr:MAG: hypothetical protein BMS9Abin13_305 [Patescibacteria group bacterium]